MGAVSSSLLAATRLMATHIPSVLARWIAPAWLFVILFTLSTTRLGLAQSVTSGAFAVVQERISEPNGQTRISYTIATTFDSVPPPIRSTASRYRQAIKATPTWPKPDPVQWEQTTDPTIPGAFYIIATSPMAQPRKPGHGWLNIPPHL